MQIPTIVAPNFSAFSGPIPATLWSWATVRGRSKTMLRRVDEPSTKNCGRPILSASDLRQSRRRRSSCCCSGVSSAAGSGGLPRRRRSAEEAGGWSANSVDANSVDPAGARLVVRRGFAGFRDFLADRVDPESAVSLSRIS